MPDTTPPIAVRSNTGLIDTATAALRYAVVIVGSVPVLLAFLGSRDFAGLVAFFRGEDGAGLIAAVSAIVSLGYGLWKTYRRGDQVVTIAADPRVPDAVAQVR